MNLSKLQNFKEIVDVSKGVFNKYKGGGQNGSSSTTQYNNGHPSHYSYGPYGYGPGPSQCHGNCMSGGRKSTDPRQLISSIKNSKQLKSLPQTLQNLAALKHGHGSGGGGVKKILPQVLKGIKSRM